MQLHATSLCSNARVVGTSGLVDAQEVSCREIGFTLRDRGHGVVVGEDVDDLERINTSGGGGLSRGAGVAEQFGYVQRDAGLGRVQRHVLERLDQVANLGFGIGVRGH